jgi:medium-chain acyl-[acyl-carrier-protein] hydrolase
VHLFVSGAASPAAPRTRPAVHAASDEDVIRELRSLNGTPPELLADEELMDLLLPTLRADFAVLETYEHRPGPPLPVPITAFGGSADPDVPPSALAGWRRESAVGTRVQVFPGDHFLHGAAAEVVAAVAGTLGPARAALR